MKGLELSIKFYEEHGKGMLKSQFSHLLPYLAVGLVGSGSECYGYDDEISQDHDFEPGFCIFLPGEDVVDRRAAFELERAYAKLPKEFMGFSRNAVNPVGGNRHGVIRMSDFFEAKTGSRDGSLSVGQWLSLPDYALKEAVNGAVFCDNYGEFSRIREKLWYYPEDIRLKKLSGHLLLMGQAGQYNYGRCVKRGETGAAQIAVFEFAKSAMQAIFLLKKEYAPYYKWSFRALGKLGEDAFVLSKQLEFLITSANDEENVQKKEETIETICQTVSAMLIEQNLTQADSAEMEQQAYIINNLITDSNLRNMHILSGV